VFKSLDKNGDGKLSKDEVKDGYLEHYGRLICDDEVDAMFAAVDTDESGFIEYTEFVIASINQKKLLSVDKLKATFKMFDKDGNGSITPSEIKTVLQTDSSIPNEVI